MSNDTSRDCLFVGGTSESGKTTLIETMLGEYQAPAIVVDSTGEWGQYSPTNGTFRDVREVIERAAEQQEFPPRVMHVQGMYEAEQLFAYVTDGARPGEPIDDKTGIGCTLVIDEADRFLPSRGKPDPHLVAALRRGRHIPPGDAGISVVTAAHTIQNVDTTVLRHSSVVAFRMTETNAKKRLQGDHIHDRIDPGQIPRHEYAVGMGANLLSFPVGEHGPWTYQLDLETGRIVPVRRFNADGSTEQINEKPE